MHFDGYFIKARLFPAVLVLLPIWIFLRYHYFRTFDYSESALELLLISSLTYFVGTLARDTGKKIEKEAYSMWGGKPTTMFLRHNDNRLNPLTKERYHRVLQMKLGGYIPSPEQENEHPKSADQVYENWVHWLISISRDRERHYLLISDLTNYNFRRNLFGLKKIGLSIVMVVTIFHCFMSENKLCNFIPTKEDDILFLLFLICMAAAWIFIIKMEWIKTAAEIYAKRLLEVIDRLDSPPIISK